MNGRSEHLVVLEPAEVEGGDHAADSLCRLPNSGTTIGPLYNVNPNVFNTGTVLVRPTKEVGNDSRVFNGVDVTFSLRNAKGITFSGGTSTGKVENDWCEIRAAVPESFLLNPYCHVESPWQTAFRGLVAYTIPRIDVQLSSVLQDKANIATDQLGSLGATYALTAADQAAAAAQIGRPLTATGPLSVNLLAGSQLYGPRIRQWDFAAKKIIRFGDQRLTVGADLYNLLNNNVTLGFSGAFLPNVSGWQSPTSYMNPRVIRLNAEFAFKAGPIGSYQRTLGVWRTPDPGRFVFRPEAFVKRRVVHVALVLVVGLGAVVPAAQAQTDFSGEWTVVRSMDNTENPWVGDWVGLPLNPDGIARAESWDASLLSLPEYQCRPHGWAYIYRGPTQLRITKEVDPFTREVVAYQPEWHQSTNMPVYLDGREPPPAEANHTWGGFSTATWEGDMLKIKTTHL